MAELEAQVVKLQGDAKEESTRVEAELATNQKQVDHLTQTLRDTIQESKQVRKPQTSKPKT